LIDPTGLQLDAQAVNPGDAATVWVSLATGLAQVGGYYLSRYDLCSDLG